MAEPQASQPASQPKDYPFVPKQLRDQMAAADKMRAEMGQVEEPQAQPAAPSTPADAAVTGAPPPADDQTTEQRLRSIQGRYEQERTTNKQLLDRLTELENAMSSMQAKGVQAAPAPQPDVPPARPTLVTDTERTEYGDELLTVIGKRAKEEYAPEFEMLAQRLKRLEGRFDGASDIITRQQTGTVYQQLDANIPEWKAVNRSEDFKAWLQRPDLYSGRRRADMLSEAFARHEANRVLAFFQGFISEAAGTPSTASSSPGSSAPPLASPVANGNGNGSGKPSLEDFAAPGRARSAPQQLPPDKPVYSTAWIAKFMADKRSGKYRGREADADAIERDIFQAQHEGRIQP